MLLFKTKLKILIKKLVHLTFITKFIGRIAYQKFYKTKRMFQDHHRFNGTLWVDWHKEVFDSWALKKNKDIYEEAVNFYFKFNKERKQILSGLPISGGDNNATTGGGGNEVLLYFLTRIINAKNALETGVSAGSSSRSILEALKVNGEGKLFSSDLATVLQKNQVGILVGKSFKSNWYLWDQGDKENLPLIFQKDSNFDLIYYDSDKSYDAKKWFHSEIIKKNTPKILVYDDVDRNSFFSECVKLYGYNFKVFGNAGIIFFDKKYL